MKAALEGTVVAEATPDELVTIEGNWYFAPSSLKKEHFAESPTGYTCSWKGDAQYYTLAAGDATLSDGAWSYPAPPASAFDRVGADFSGWVAFDRRVTISE